MEERTTVVIDIQLDENKVAERLAAVNSEMEELKTQNKELKKAIKEGDDALGHNSKQLADNEAKLKSLKAEQSALSGQVSTLTKNNRNYGTSIKELSAKLADMKDQYRSLSAEERDSAKGQEFLQKIQELDAEVKDADYSIGNFQRNVGNYPDAVKPVTAQLREMTQELIRLRMEGKANTEEYNELLKKTGEIKDAMMDAQNEVKQMASDTSALNSVLAGAQAAAGAFSVALGVMNLVGDKDSETAKELAEAQRKLQSAIAITTGLQALQNALQKESALMMGVNQIKIAAAAAAQRLYAAATRDATAAQNVFNKVAKSSPYIWLAGIILSVVGAIAAFSRGSKEQDAALEEVNVELQHHADVLKRITDSYDTLNATAHRYIEDHIKDMKRQGASTEEIRKAEDELFKNRKEELLKERELYERELVLYPQIKAALEDNIGKMISLERERTNALKNGDMDRAKFYQNEIDNLNKVMEAQRKSLGLVDDWNARFNTLMDEQKQKEEDRKKEDEENARKAQERWRKNAEAIREANKALIEASTADELYKKGEENNAKLAKSFQEVADRVGLFADELKDLPAPKDIPFISDAGLTDSTSQLELFAESYKENAQAIQETSGALTQSFSSLSSMYQQMAQDESKTEEERAKAARKAKAWASIQVAANAGAAIAKGVASAVDVGFPAAIPAMATMTAAILSAIAQAKAMLSQMGGFETGGVIGGYRGATMGKDNAFASVRTGEMVINAAQQKRLFEIANGGMSTNLTASLVEALQAMPAPVLVYSEFQSFTQRVATLDDAAKLQ